MRAHIEVQASRGDDWETVLVDIEDFVGLAGRSLSIGSHGYAQVWADQKVQLFHRWLFGVSGQGYRVLVDHINRDGLDCRRQNLRLVSPSVSNLNRSPSDGPLVGTYRARSGRWVARFWWRCQQHYVGTFATREEAAEALYVYRLRHCPESIGHPTAA